MIIDPFALQDMTNEAICFDCHKLININSPFYEMSLMRDISLCASSAEYLNRVQKHSTGSGAILRFHIECFSIIAGEDYMFDQMIWR